MMYITAMIVSNKRFMFIEFLLFIQYLHSRTICVKYYNNTLIRFRNLIASHIITCSLCHLFLLSILTDFILQQRRLTTQFPSRNKHSYRKYKYITNNNPAKSLMLLTRLFVDSHFYFEVIFLIVPSFIFTIVTPLLLGSVICLPSIV